MNCANGAIQRQSLLLLLLGGLLAVPLALFGPGAALAAGRTGPTIPAPEATVGPPATAAPDTTVTPAPTEVPASPPVGGGAVADGPTASPDLVILVGAGPTTELHLASVRQALAPLNGIAWTARDASVQPAQILIGLEPGEESTGLRAVEGVLSAHPAGTELTLTGRALTDRTLGDRLALGAVVAAVLAVAAVTALVTWSIRLSHGLLAGGAVALSALLGSILAARAAGPLDGSVVATVLPGVLVAVLVSSYLVLRLLIWFAEPEGVDSADMIRRSVLGLGVELALFLAGLAVITVFLEVVSPSRTVAVVVLVASVVATMATLAVVPPVLTVLHGRADEVGARPAGLDGGAAALDGAEVGAAGPDGAEVGAADRARPEVGAGRDPSVPVFRSFGSVFPGPDGRQVPVGVLIGFGALLGLLSLFSFQGTSPARLFDDRDVPTEASAVLLASGGDPTSAIVAEFPSGVDQQARTAWLNRVSQLPSVARVETATGRYVDGARVELESFPLAGAGIDEGDETPELALVIPTVAARSPEAQDLVTAIEAADSPVGSTLSGAPVDARSASQRDGSSVWLLIVTLALVSGAGALGLIGDPALAGVAAGLRLVGSAAVVGLYHLLADDVTGSELQLVVLLSAAGCALFELGFLRRLLQGHRVEDTETLLDHALQREGWAAVVGLTAVAVASLGLLVVDLHVVRRLAVMVLIAVLLEVMVGMWLLRPPVLGVRAVRHFATQPVRAALHTLLGGSHDDEIHGEWAAVVADLLHDEFALQSEPTAADLERVFVAGTPLHRKANDHHEHLASAGLRILGREPQLRTVRVVGRGERVTVAVTVDHPPRQLVNTQGEVLGVRKPERRSVMLWLVEADDGSHRIADTVELGIEPLGEGVGVGAESAPVTANLPDPASR